MFNSKFLHLLILTLFPKGFEIISKEIRIYFFQINLELSALVMKHLKSCKNWFNDTTLVCMSTLSHAPRLRQACSNSEEGDLYHQSC